MTELQIAERARLRDARAARRGHRPFKKTPPPPARVPAPPRVLLTPEQRAAVSRSNLKKANLSRQSLRGTPEAIATVWWLGEGCCE